MPQWMHFSWSSTGIQPVREVDRSFHAVLPGVRNDAADAAASRSPNTGSARAIGRSPSARPTPSQTSNSARAAPERALVRRHGFGMLAGEFLRQRLEHVLRRRGTETTAHSVPSSTAFGRDFSCTAMPSASTRIDARRARKGRKLFGHRTRRRVVDERAVLAESGKRHRVAQERRVKHHDAVGRLDRRAGADRPVDRSEPDERADERALLLRPVR